ncbi:MAG TPA: hypothetical protein VMM15_08585 [Bradyrhizobium sp.]|nr:hypothetical protein [Bradyrhizobium sp.]
MVDPDNAVPARAMTGELGEDPVNAWAPASSRISQTLLEDKHAASTGDSDRDDHEAPRRAPTMWR